METKMQITTSTFIAITVSMVSQTVPFRKDTHYTIMYTAPSGPKYTRKRIIALDTLTYLSSSECRFLKPFRETIWLPARFKKVIGLTHIVWLQLQNHRYYSRYHLKLSDQLRFWRHKRIHRAHSLIRETDAWHHSSVIKNPWIFWRKFGYLTNNDLLLHLQEWILRWWYCRCHCDTTGKFRVVACGSNGWNLKPRERIPVLKS